MLATNRLKVEWPGGLMALLCNDIYITVMTSVIITILNFALNIENQDQNRYVRGIKIKAGMLHKELYRHPKFTKTADSFKHRLGRFYTNDTVTVMRQTAPLTLLVFSSESYLGHNLLSPFSEGGFKLPDLSSLCNNYSYLCKSDFGSDHTDLLPVKQ